jgi:hypothetical protein
MGTFKQIATVPTGAAAVPRTISPDTCRRLVRTIVRRNAANHGEQQEGDDRDRQHKQEVGDASLEPMHLNLPRAEKGLAEVEDPERQRNAEQNSADGCEREMQGGQSYTMAFRSKMCRSAKILSSPLGPPFPRKPLITLIK